MSDNLLLWLTVIWLPFLMYGILRNETRFKKNIVVGVTLPQEAHEDPDVLMHLKTFKRNLLLVCLALLLIAVLCVMFPQKGIASTIWMIWLDLAIFAPFIPYVLCNNHLKSLKQQRGWAGTGVSDIANLSAASIPVRWLSPYAFLAPLVVALIPAVFDPNMLLLYGIDAASILFFWFGYRYLYRNKAETVDDNLLLTEALSRMRRYQWGKCWLLCSWFMVALNWFIWLSQSHIWLELGGILIITAALVAAIIRVEFHTRKLQETLTAESGSGVYIDEDDKWPWGIFYYDPNDSRLLINSRIGMNSTMNLARPAGKVILGLSTLLLLAMPLLGIWIDHLEDTPVSLSIEDSCVVALHTGPEYQIPLQDIHAVTYLEALPNIHRIAGTGMESVQKGRFKTPWGTARTCLDPRVGPYLLIETADHLYLLGSSDSQETQIVYEHLAELF